MKLFQTLALIFFYKKVKSFNLFVFVFWGKTSNVNITIFSPCKPLAMAQTQKLRGGVLWSLQLCWEFWESSTHLLQLWCRCLESPWAQRKRWLPCTSSGPSWGGAHCHGEVSPFGSGRRGRSFPAESGPLSPQIPTWGEKAGVLEECCVKMLVLHNVIAETQGR